MPRKEDLSYHRCKKYDFYMQIFKNVTKTLQACGKCIYICQPRNMYVIMNVKELIWLPTVKYLKLLLNSPQAFTLSIDTNVYSFKSYWHK